MHTLYMFRASYKQWEISILILVNAYTLIEYRIVKMDNCPNLNTPAGTRSLTLSRLRQTHEPLDAMLHLAIVELGQHSNRYKKNKIK